VTPSAELMEAARLAGVRQWWGDGPRPLNLPGADPTSAVFRGEPYRRRVDDHAALVTPLILEPTPAQLARGERVLWIEQTSAKTAMAMMNWANAHGWSARLSRSRYLTAPISGGQTDRRGRRLEVETVCLRLRREPQGVLCGTAAALGWNFDMERRRWKPSGGLMCDIAPGTLDLYDMRQVSIIQMKAMLGMGAKGSEDS
jgi:hypothetical protein